MPLRNVKIPPNRSPLGHPSSEAGGIGTVSELSSAGKYGERDNTSTYNRMTDRTPSDGFTDGLLVDTFNDCFRCFDLYAARSSLIMYLIIACIFETFHPSTMLAECRYSCRMEDTRMELT
jgi:hypothetical protein